MLISVGSKFASGIKIVLKENKEKQNNTTKNKQDIFAIFIFNQITRFSIKLSMLDLRLVSKLNYFIYKDIDLKFQHFVSILKNLKNIENFLLTCS